ncbi:hypothetical protein JKP88DRAFT_271905 [Tribonema minus]|uniref:Uncharacterized protein n=1 Tax=Tribonema minus TaxID=303371 RepID=A0A836CI09_9STRA|nr:hypothetical protein JKP88DRAFT_271905 [Tribonema minus]
MAEPNGQKSAAAGDDGLRRRQGADNDKTSWWTILLYIVIVLISKYTLPTDLHPVQPTLNHVWYYGWVTAVSTGLGAVPLLFASELGEQMLGVSNAIACGMMLSASYSLIMEGANLPADPDCIVASAALRVAAGVLAGLAFILPAKKVLDKYEDIHIGDLVGVDAKKALLIVLVMFLHSFSEGVGIGVSFGGSTGAQLGFLISATLAVHNIPEGLAVALVLHPRGVSKLNTGLWCIFTSLPQPLMAVLAYKFVEQFLPFLPVGLGFAAGAMFWVAIAELAVEAVESTSLPVAISIMVVSFCTMLYLHSLLEAAEGG